MLRLVSMVTGLALMMSACLGQEVEVKQVQVKAITGFTTAKLGGAAILIDDKAVPKVVTAKVVLVETECKFVSMLAIQKGEIVPVDQLSPKEFLVPSNGAGSFIAIVTVSDPGHKMVPVKIEFESEPVVPTPGPSPPGPTPPGPTPGPLPDAFDGLATKVRTQSTGLSKRLEVAANYREYAKKLVDGSNPTATVGSISSEMVAKRNTLLGENQVAWLNLIAFLNSDLTSRWPMDKRTLSEYWLAIAAGLEAPSL